MIGLRTLALALPVSLGLALPAIAQEPEGAPASDQEAVPMEPAEPAFDTAELMGLNKITARTHPMSARIDDPVRFSTLGITVRACHKARPEEPPKTVAYLEIREYPLNEEITEEPEPIFSGWMLASSPGLNALEHPVYDIWVTDCRMSSGDSPSGSE